MNMIKVVLFGTGNLATHLYKAFSTALQIELTAIWGRKTPSKKTFGNAPIRTSSLLKIPKADVYVICISDDAVAKFSAQLPNQAFVVHTSGALDLNVLEQKRSGIFWPIQTFSKKRAVAFNEVPVCIEAKNVKDLALLKQLATAIKANYVVVNSKQRAYLHLAAVYVNNFVNELYNKAHGILQTQQLSFELLTPLILETTNKAITSKPKDIQTGPAKRGDKTVMNKHKSLLDSEQKKLYVTLSEAIYKTHNNNEL